MKFGTDGVRGVANVDLTPSFALDLGRAAARVLASGPNEGVEAVVGGDTRVSTAMLEAWREVCRREWRKARLLPRGADDPQRLNHRLRTGWMRLGRAVGLALEARGQIGDVA